MLPPVTEFILKFDPIAFFNLSVGIPSATLRHRFRLHLSSEESFA